MLRQQFRRKYLVQKPNRSPFPCLAQQKARIVLTWSHQNRAEDAQTGCIYDVIAIQQVVFQKMVICHQLSSSAIILGFLKSRNMTSTAANPVTSKKSANNKFELNWVINAPNCGQEFRKFRVWTIISDQSRIIVEDSPNQRISRIRKKCCFLSTWPRTCVLTQPIGLRYDNNQAFNYDIVNKQYEGQSKNYDIVFF